jgi:hypothetical protein
MANIIFLLKKCLNKKFKGEEKENAVNKGRKSSNGSNFKA